MVPPLPEQPQPNPADSTKSTTCTQTGLTMSRTSVIIGRRAVLNLEIEDRIMVRFQEMN